MRQLVYFLKIYLFWILMFLSGRILFLLLNYRQLFPATFEPEPLKALYKGILQDLSTASYLLIPVFIVWLITRLYYRSRFNTLTLFYHYLVIIALSIILVAHARLYSEWGTPVNARAIYYLTNPQGVYASLGIVELLLLIALVVFMLMIFIRNFRKWRLALLPLPPVRKSGIMLSSVILAGMLIILLRGGFGQLPVNESSAFYSNRQVENHLATNPVWYLTSSLLGNLSHDDRFIVMDIRKAQSLFLGMTGCEQKAVASKQPNIVLLIVESLSSDLTGLKENDIPVMPFFDQLKSQGLYFSRIYSSGFRTDQGLVSILSGYPAQPEKSILRYPEKVETLPSVIRGSRSAGYETSFIYGGDLDFANMRLLLAEAGTDYIYDINHHALDTLPDGKWGVQDRDMLKKSLELIEALEEPFFTGILTLSMHAPYDFEGGKPFPDENERGRLLNAARYTDRSLQHFLTKAASKDWFRNTIFVITGDHGSLMVNDRFFFDPDTRKIPLLFWGAPLADSLRKREITVPGNLHDLPATIGRFIRMEGEKFPFSRDLLCDMREPFAYITYDPGFGWITPEVEFTYFSKQGIYTWPGGDFQPPDTLLERVKAYQQVLWMDFISR